MGVRLMGGEVELIYFDVTLKSGEVAFGGNVVLLTVVEVTLAEDENAFTSHEVVLISSNIDTLLLR